MSLTLPPVKSSRSSATGRKHPDIHVGDSVRIIDMNSAFNLRQGKVIAHNPPGYLVKLFDSPLSVSCSWNQIVPYASKDEIETPATEVMANLYRRYMWIKFETMSEVLELLKLTSTIDEVRETLCGFMHQNYNSCLRHPVDVVQMLPREDSIVLNALVKEFRSVKRNKAKKRGM
jgi:hypothetical protein